MGQIEEITDIIREIKKDYTPENFKKLGIKKGKVMKFSYEGSPVVLRITKVLDGRYWAEHIELTPLDVGFSHYGHLLDSTDEMMKQYGVPWCQDCERPVNQRATQLGDRKAAVRNEIQITKERIKAMKKVKKLGKGWKGKKK